MTGIPTALRDDRAVASAGFCCWRYDSAAHFTDYPGQVRPFKKLQSSCENVQCADVVRIGFEAARHAFEQRLRLAVFLRNMAAPTKNLRTRLTRIGRRHREREAASPCHLVFELATQFEPSLIQDGLVQARLLSH